MFDVQLRDRLEAGLRPVGLGIRRAGFTADQLTLIGVLMAACAAVAIANGALRGGLLLLLLAAVPDVLDGAVAKATGSASRRGAFFDSVADRVTEALLLGGVAWYLASVSGSSKVAILPLAVLAVSIVVSYERAKAESLGFDARGGLMERAERLLALALGLMFDSFLVLVLWVMLVLTGLTAVQRFVRVWRAASASQPAPARRWRGRRLARTTPRETWRARRERWARLREEYRRYR